MKKYHCMLEAHRGDGLHAPENTLAAFALAKTKGFDMIELDPRFTKDGRCVILHDCTVNRTGRHEDGSPLAAETPITALTLEEARRLDMGIAFDEKYRGEKIPLLEEALDFSLKNGIPLKFDCVLQTHTAAQAAYFFDTVEDMRAQDAVGFTANQLPFLRMLLARLPGSTIHYDGPVNAEILKALARMVPREKLTVWVRYDNRRTSWHNSPAATAEYCAMIKEFANLGIWLLEKPGELEIAAQVFGADIIETDGSIQPGDIR